MGVKDIQYSQCLLMDGDLSKYDWRKVGMGVELEFYNTHSYL